FSKKSRGFPRCAVMSGRSCCIPQRPQEPTGSNLAAKRGIAATRRARPSFLLDGNVQIRDKLCKSGAYSVDALPRCPSDDHVGPHTPRTIVAKAGNRPFEIPLLHISRNERAIVAPIYMRDQGL